MTWRFTIIQGVQETEISEPVGWDNMTKVIKRDPEWHGVVFNFSENNLQFFEEAYWILKDEYADNGVDGDVSLRIEWKCDDCEDFELFYTGKFDFQRYQEVCGDNCFITIGLEDADANVMIKNRMDTAVDLTNNKAYDGTTTLTGYTALGTEIEVPGKVLLIRSRAENDASSTTGNITDDTEWTPNTSGSDMRAMIVPGFNKELQTELADTTFLNQPSFVNGGFSNSPNGVIIPIIDLQKFSTLSCIQSNAELKYRFKGTITSTGGLPSAGLRILKLPAGLDQYNGANYVTLATHPLGSSGVPFDIAETLSITLATGDRIYYYIFLFIYGALGYSNYELVQDQECFFELSLNSLCEPSPAKTYFIHEAASRIIEHITNNAIKFKSEYFGRTDSQPYSYAGDGCGGLRTITNGLQLRRAVLQDNSNPKVFLSLKDLLISLNAIDCVGMGLEGTDLRVEPIDYFYSNDIIFIADGVNEITTNVMNERIWNQFSFGYDKFETESANGLDAIHTKRQYRLAVVNTEGKLEKYSKLIADGYAIEVTRRKFGISDDWRYDQNIFLLCLIRSGGDILVDQDNITTPSNIFDAATVINYAISPIRNAMRWFRWIVQGIRSYATTKAIFSSGEGNYVAEGLLNTGCIIEDSAIAENQTLEAAIFDDLNAATPFILPEKVTFKYPMGLNEFVDVAAAKYGKVQYRKNDDGPWKYGWIDQLKYSPEDGEAEFSLITCNS